MPRGELALREARIVGLYAEAKKRLLGELTKVGLSSYNEARVEEARQRVNSIIATLGKTVGREAAAAVRAAYVGQARTTATQAEILGFRRAGPEPIRSSGPGEALGRLRRYLEEANGTIRRSMDNFFGALRIAAGAISRIQEFGDEDRALYIANVELAAAEAVASNWSRRRLQTILLDRLYNLIEGGDFIVINGRNYDIRKYAKMVARTEYRRAQTEAAKETCGRYECDLVEWSRHANACKLCVPHEGKVFSLSGKDAKYPALAGLEPPLHPNCGHSILATSRQAIAAREEEASA